MKLLTIALLTLATATLQQDKAPVAAQQTLARPTTVFFVRHAEDTGKDERPLSEAGQKRAARLRRLLSHAGVTHVFSSEYDRTQQTVAPLATATGKKVQTIKAAKPKMLVDALKALPGGSVAVVCGHSNTLPPLLKRLGIQLTGLNRRGFIGHDAHDRLFTVTLGTPKKTRTHCVELRYGN